jgi:hypothetical protein
VAASTDDKAPALQLTGLRKAFGEIVAVDDGWRRESM